MLAVSSVPLAAIADTDAQADDGDTAKASEAKEQNNAKKDEVIYVKADASGDVEGMYAVNKFEAGAGDVDDPADYTSVQNLSTRQTLTQVGDTVAVEVGDGEPFYYQGDLESGRELPWDISIAYYLDGKAVQPQDLAGQSGTLRMEVSIDSLTDADAEGVSDFANSYLVQAQGTFDASKFAIDDAGDAMIATSGNNTVVSCMVLPGESQTFTIEGQATDFESEGWQVACMSLSMAIDISEADTSQLTEKADELKDATGELSSGASELNDGASSLMDGANSAASGASSIASGAASLSAGVSELQSKSGDLATGISSAATGANTLAENGATVSVSAQQLSDGALQLSSGAAQLKAGSDQFQAGLAASTQVEDYGQVQSALVAYQAQLALVAAGQAEASSLDAYVQAIVSASANYGAAKGANETIAQVQGSYAGIAGGIDSLNTNAATLASGTEALFQGLQTYVQGVSQLASGLSGANDAAAQAVSGIDALASGSNELASGTQSLASGTQTLASGAASLQSGSSQLASGAAELVDAVSNIDDEILDELQQTIDEKLGADFEVHSYVVPSNTNVNSVQFVYVLDAIEVDDDDEESESAAESANSTESDDSSSNSDASTKEKAEGFVDKFFALFDSGD